MCLRTSCILRVFRMTNVSSFDDTTASQHVSLLRVIARLIAHDREQATPSFSINARTFSFGHDAYSIGSIR